jgi:ribosome-associated protein
MAEERPSKTQLKKQMHDLQALGAELVELKDEQLASVDLPERLLDAVRDARRITKFEARRRQLQYIGKLMRDVDPEPIRTRLDAWKSVSRAQTARLQLLERWRTRLIEEPDALTAFMREYPHADTARLKLLVRNTHDERENGRPPKNYRALFQLLSEIVQESEAGGGRRQAQSSTGSGSEEC